MHLNSFSKVNQIKFEKKIEKYISENDKIVNIFSKLEYSKFYRV